MSNKLDENQRLLLESYMYSNIWVDDDEHPLWFIRIDENRLWSTTRRWMEWQESHNSEAMNHLPFLRLFNFVPLVNILYVENSWHAHGRVPLGDYGYHIASYIIASKNITHFKGLGSIHVPMIAYITKIDSAALPSEWMCWYCPPNLDGTPPDPRHVDGNSIPVLDMNLALCFFPMFTGIPYRG